ncbi:ejaculatory bulb-specific protein 3-like [Macrosteles quadrilineatus]|uniref:ejaculatory bulb-specific protein 3-like n=1 Tax=Macrosteles quadrilineatus TaxID=74068 RepID=UPI0023E2DF8A|nr:ejaculatory bulb-specific protein 3-like [Macrosteles quadrilineatus]XP_054278838.1 ejaculatory bulb-specific protein 3-like [Macrosteles quadrilineatus]
MRARSLVLSVFVSVLCVLCVSDTRAYYVRYLNVTANTLLDNKRLLSRYVQCFASEGPCPPQARDIKKLLPELMSSSCSKCDIKLREVFERCAQMLKHKYPKKWSKMVKSKPKSPNAI